MKNYSVRFTNPPGGQYWEVSADSMDASVLLRPGSMIPFNENSEQLYKTTEEIQTSSALKLIVNRDSQGASSGKLFMSGGEKMSELEKHEYQFYEFALSGNFLKKRVMNEFNTTGSLRQLDSVLIVNAEDLQNVAFACYMDQNNIPHRLSYAYQV
jgi:alpha-glucosidase (family GH31 glycosyl hydrolase)